MQQTSESAHIDEPDWLLDQFIVDRVYIPAFITFALDLGITLSDQEDIDGTLLILDLLEKFIQSGSDSDLTAPRNYDFWIFSNDKKVRQEGMRREAMNTAMLQEALADPEIRRVVCARSKSLALMRDAKK